MKKAITTHAAAAKAIRKHLKARGIAGTVRSSSYAGGTSLRVGVQDLDPAALAELNAHCKQHQYGHFDGMSDSYEFSNSRQDIPQVKFVFVEVEYSDELKQAAWDDLRVYCSGTDHLPADFVGARNMRFWDYMVCEHVHQYLLGSHTMRFCSERFWAARTASELQAAA